jgi:hypothetical protein
MSPLRAPSTIKAKASRSAARHRFNSSMTPA